MDNTIELLRLAKKLDQCLSVQYDEKTFKFKVDLNMIVFKDQYLRQNIYGLGFTLEDACFDYLRKCRGGKLCHAITEIEIDVI